MPITAVLEVVSLGEVGRGGAAVGWPVEVSGRGGGAGDEKFGEGVVEYYAVGLACYVAGGIEICEAGGSFEVEGGDWSAQDGEGEGEEEEERDGGGVHVFFWGGGAFLVGFWLNLVLFEESRR